MRVLVTGGAGFIGGRIVEVLADAGHEAVVLDRVDRTPPPGATSVVADLSHPDGWAGALEGIEAVCHQAAKVGLGVDMGDVVDYVSDNDLGTARLLAALHRVGFSGRLVLASSMVVYGEGAYRCGRCGTVRPQPRRVEDLEAGHYEPRCPECGDELDSVPVSEDAPTDPRNVYAATKLHQEHLFDAYGRETDSPVISLRYHNVYGPNMPRDTPYAGVAAIFKSAIAGGRPVRVFEDGRQRRDFVHVDDVARANMAALTADRSVTGPFNIASGRPATVAEMAETLVEAAGSTVEVKVVGGYRIGDVRHVVASPARAAEELGFSAGIGLEEGMAEFAAAPLGPEQT